MCLASMPSNNLPTCKTFKWCFFDKDACCMLLFYKMLSCLYAAQRKQQLLLPWDVVGCPWRADTMLLPSFWVPCSTLLLLLC